MKFRVSLLAMLLLVSRAAFAEESVDLWHGAERISYETVTLSDNERMGLAGFHYLLDVAPPLYTGLGLFGAVSGDRGGFFTGGFETGLRQPLIGAFSLDAGLFLGGGGGRNSRQGGGLMVRPHLGLVYDAGAVRLALAYSLVDFPNGDIRSDQPTFYLDIPFEALRIAPDRPRDLTALLDRVSLAENRPIIFNREHLVARYTVYSPPDKVRDRDTGAKTGTIQLTGIEYGRDWGERTYVFVEASGASGGRADGYAEVFFGGGYRVPIAGQRLSFDGRISLGTAGGGSVDTGGGGAAKASLGLKFAVASALSIDARAGYETSAGEFHARTAEFGLSYDFDSAAFGGMVRRPAADELRIDSWQTRFSFQQYISRRPSMRKDSGNHIVSLLGGTLDKFIGTGPFYLTGQAQSAVSGGAGGYAVGLMGIGYLSKSVAETGIHVFVEALGGAAGGGGLDVGGGSVFEPQAGVVFDLGKIFSVESSIGRIKALHGGLDSTVVGVSIVYRFSTIGRKGGCAEAPFTPDSGLTTPN